MKRKRDTKFDCPICGNPLIRSKRYQKIRCIYCKSYVDVPGINKNNNKKEDK